jgi:hypothetical protein
MAMMPISRRNVLHRLGGAAIYGVAESLASPLLLARSDARVTPDIVTFRPEVEPLVGLIERTPRDRCAEMLVEQLRHGVSYRQLLGALFLAGIRNINPRPPGFALHCVFVIHSAHLIGLEAPADLRLLPLFYALDNFKIAQERDARQPSGDFTMRAIRDPLPAPDRAAAEFEAAMEAWEPERAERAVVSLARHRSPGEVFEMLWRYGARDYRNIGHKAIFAANAFRTLHAVGWQHSEPVLRSLTLAMLDFGKQQQVNGYALDDQCYGGNVKRVKETFSRLNPAWVREEAQAPATRGILGSIRESTPEEACAEVADRLVKASAGAGAVWDAVHLAAAELRMRAKSSAALAAVHAVTSANALHYAYLTASDPQVRYLLLLQAVGWMGQFRKFAETRPDGLRPFVITGMEPQEKPPVDRALTETFAGIPANPDAAARNVFRFAGDLPARQAFLAEAVRLILGKADEVHYYKYLAAMIEDVPLVSPAWQPHVLAATVYYAKGTEDSESQPMKRAREALRALPA